MTKKMMINMKESTNSKPLKKYKILAVNDSKFYLSTLSLFLKDTQYDIICANSAIEALQVLGNGQCPDLFILTIDMPIMNGYELAQRIRECGQKAPIIFLSGNVKRDYVLKAIEAGATDFITKPISFESILERIDSIFVKFIKTN